MKKILLSLSVAALFATTSCKKDKETTNQSVTPTKENLVGTWKITAATVSSGGQNVNVFNNSNESINFFEPCERDDRYQLNADLTYAYIDAGTQCDPEGSYEGTWNLVNATTMQVDGQDGTIKSFNGTSLVTEVDLGGSTFTVTYTKQ